MKNEHTGPFREYWNYFKRGKSELNFLLNVYQTLVIIWGVEAITQASNSLVGITVVFGLAILIAAIVLGKYSLTRVDTALAYMNPFVQDVVIFRRDIARGLEFLSLGQNQNAEAYFYKAQDRIEKWMVEK